MKRNFSLIFSAEKERVAQAKTFIFIWGQPYLKKVEVTSGNECFEKDLQNGKFKVIAI